MENICEELTLPEIRKVWTPVFAPDDFVRYISPEGKEIVGQIANYSNDENFCYDVRVSDKFLDKTIEEELLTKWEPRRGEIVLVRNANNHRWEEAVFSYSFVDDDNTIYATVGGKHWNYCIPFQEWKLGGMFND